MPFFSSRHLGRWTALLAFGAAIAACTSTRRSTGDDDDGDGGHTGSGGSGVSVPGGPEVFALTVMPTAVTESDHATFTAMVTDPDGLADIVGGMLTTLDGAPYGPFMQLSEGTFSIVVTWDQLHQVAPIEFASDTVRSFRAVFTDTTQKTGSRTVELTLTCNGHAACGGECASAAEPGLCEHPECASSSAPECCAACNTLFACTQEPELCPGIGPEDEATVVDSCMVQCAMEPTLVSLIDPADCAATISTIVAVDYEFAAACGVGVPPG